jgi:hypothetical protein
VCTSTAENSIWRHLPENTFRQHIVDLEEKTNAVPVPPQIFSAAEWLLTSPHASENSHSLPLDIEQQFADDFSCLAAVEEGAQSVAAVCIEEHVHPDPKSPRLTLRFAALDIALNDTVKTALQDFAIVLSRASLFFEDTSLSDPVEELYHGVIRLHFRRLLARLRSCKWEKPKYLSRSHKKPLGQDFDNLIHRSQFMFTKKEKVRRELVQKLLSGLAATYAAFESADEDPKKEALDMESLVNASFEFCSMEAVRDYLIRLETSVGSKSTPQVASAIKSLRQIQKIAAYRRISIFLVKIAQTYPHLFKRGISLVYLAPYQSVPASIAYEEWAATSHVHAEIQLAVHYDLLSQQSTKEKKTQIFLCPRTIGISKSLCYLCYHFLRAHKSFFPSRTHGRLYDQWTVPDLAEFDEKLVTRYSKILMDVDQEIVRHAENEPQMSRIEPMTSVDVYSTATEI